MISAYAHTNIALIKYWGKLPGDLNLPATGSLSMTLDRFGTRTSVSISDEGFDTFELDGAQQIGPPLMRVTQFLDRVRLLSGKTFHCHVESNNDVPTSAGLASSASGFAALAIAADKLFGLGLTPTELSKLARQGSGSAARSIFGGFAILETDHAVPIKTPLDLNMIVVQCARHEKKVSSTRAMNHTAATSPYYDAWLSTHPDDLRKAHDALAGGEFKTLGELMEHSTLKMHATMMAAKPGIWYFEPLTLAVMNHVIRLRYENLECYFTMDAGPHVKVLCMSQNANEIAKQLGQIAGVIQVDICAPGAGAYLL